jgi:hypothetical protein
MTNQRQTKTIAAAAIGIAVVGGMCIFAPEARSADHRDGDVTTADPTADINDVYSFMDGTNFVAVMTVFPFATTAAVDAGAPDGGAGIPGFSSAVQYVFHTASGKAFGKTTATEDIICTFKGQKAISCWVGTDDYVTGDPSSTSTALASKDGKLKVFAGLRGDPFHFNLQGFKDTEAIVESVAGSLTFNGAGCPGLSSTDSMLLLDTLSETTSTTNTAKTAADDFAAADTLAIVVSVDATLVTKGGPIVSIWGATYKAP